MRVAQILLLMAMEFSAFWLAISSFSFFSSVQEEFGNRRTKWPGILLFDRKALPFAFFFFPPSGELGTRPCKVVELPVFAFFPRCPNCSFLFFPPASRPPHWLLRMLLPDRKRRLGHLLFFDAFGGEEPLLSFFFFPG